MHPKLRIFATSFCLLGASLIMTQAAAPATPQGTIKAKGFLNIGGGTAVTDLTGNAKFPDKPDVVYYYPYFEWNATGDINTPANNAYADSYGAIMQGYFYPPSTGDYIFYLASDDGGNLYLSTDEDPANKKLIAQESGWSNPRSWDTIGGGSTVEAKNSSTFASTEWATKDTANGGAKITLTANKPYYIEALFKEGGGGDNLAVAVKDPASAIDATMPIPGKYLSPFAPATNSTIASQPANAAVYAGSSAKFSVGLDIPPAVTVNSIKWTKNGTDIPNSNTNAISIATTAADNAATIQSVITTSAGTLTSSNATLSVATISTNFSPGVLKWEFYSDISGTAVDGLTSDPKYPDSPDEVRILSSFEGPTGYADNYGARISGFIIPAETGDYVFFVSADDNASLYLSTDETPANKKLIAQESAWSNSRQWVTSAGSSDLDSKRSDKFPTTEWPGGNKITLTAGKKYYVEYLYKEGGGGDNGAVAWKKAADPDPADNSAPISGPVIGANAKPSLGTPVISEQPQSLPQLLQGRTGTLSVKATVEPAGFNYPLLVQWLKNGTNIAGANSSSLTITTNASAEANGNYVAVLSAPSGNVVTSAVATVTYAADTFAPKISSAAAVGVDAIGVTFDENLDKASAETLSNYSINGATLSKATLDPSGNLVRLTGTGLAANQQYTLTVGGVKDLFNNAVTAGTTTQFKFTFFSYADIILADKPIAFYRFEDLSGSVATNSGSMGGNGQYSVGNETTPKGGGTPGPAKPGVGPRPPQFLGFTVDNHSATFDGVGDWVDTKNQFLQNLAAFTLEYWVNPTGRSTWPTRIGLVGQNDAIEYGFIDPNTIQIWTPSGGSLNTPYPFADDEWHHVATIATGTNLFNYFDGKLVGTGGSPIGDPSTGYGGADFNVHIGGGGVFDGTGNWFKGQLDEVAIFDKAIPAERVAAHFQAGKNGSGGGGGGNTNAPAFTSVTVSGGQLTLTWGTGTLASSTNIVSTFTAVPGATSPYKAPVTGTATFYILKP